MAAFSARRPAMTTIDEIFFETLRRCSPERIVRAAAPSLPPVPLTVVALGKCAAALLDGIAQSGTVARAFAAIPDGYPVPRTPHVELAIGGHPDMTAGSFAAGERLLSFLAAHDARHVLFLISGGSSACVESPRAPFAPDDLAYANRRLVTFGLPIMRINTVRRHLSAIKGGGLLVHLDTAATSLIYSDVSTGRLSDVGSGPTLRDASTPTDAAAILETLRDERLDALAVILRTLAPPAFPPHDHAAQLLADNTTLVTTAATVARERNLATAVITTQLEDDVEAVAAQLARTLAQHPAGTLLIAGGEPTVRHHGSGRGGRCSELALRFARHAQALTGVTALFAGSDGVDGSSGAAGFRVDPSRLSVLAPGELERSLHDSDTAQTAAKLGGAIMMPPTGNNLRDLFLLARG